MARFNELCVRQTKLNKGEMMEREGRKPNVVGAHNALATLLSFVKSAT
jgi:hypothetical protein